MPLPPNRAPVVLARRMNMWLSCSQVKPMPPKDWNDSWQTSRWQSSLALLAMATASGPAVGILLNGGDGVVAEGPGALDGHEHVGHLVLHRLERADGDPELLAILDVGQRHLEEGLRGSQRLQGRGQRRFLNGPGETGQQGGTSRLAQHTVRSNLCPVEYRGEERPGQIERVHLGESALGAGHHERADPICRSGRRPPLHPCPDRPRARAWCRAVATRHRISPPG